MTIMPSDILSVSRATLAKFMSKRSMSLVNLFKILPVGMACRVCNGACNSADRSRWCTDADALQVKAKMARAELRNITSPRAVVIAMDPNA